MEVINPLEGPEDSPMDPVGQPDIGRESIHSETASPAAILQPAGFIRRAVAFIIDFFIIEFLYLILMGMGVLGVQLSGAGTGDFFPSESGLASLATPFIAAWFFLFIAYFTFFHSYDGQTPAKMIVRIKVAAESGTPLSLAQALARSFCYFVSGFFFGFGFLLSIFERKKRALHDFLVRSYVVLS